jgi:hypothetical protein
VTVGTSDIDHAWLDDIAFFRLLHWKRRMAAQDFSHQTAVARIEMLHDQHRGRKIGWKGGEYFVKRVQPAGRGSKGHDVESSVHAPGWLARGSGLACRHCRASPK